MVSVTDKVKKALVDFFRGLGRDIDEINDETDLIESTGASSDEGVDFAIDLADVLGSEVPDDFNPFVHPSGKRGMKFRELVEHAERFVRASKGGDHGA
ncbi:MAG: hypothetical protein JWN40_133 [Phycisphaerales bacterium]|nr:hypothetical protein [Phycisphaerales bacterium]